MQFIDAFRALGYELRAHRTAWSAERPNAVCLSLWSKEIRYSKDGCAFDSRRDANPIELWNHKPGFKARCAHLKRAVEEFDGAIDVVIVSGTPGQSYEDAHPWLPEERKHAWFVTAFDETTGHFSAATRPVSG